MHLAEGRPVDGDLAYVLLLRPQAVREFSGPHEKVLLSLRPGVVGGEVGRAHDPAIHPVHLAPDH